MEHIVSKKVSPIPRGYRTATPCLTVLDVDSAIAFYQAAFGAELLTRQSGADETVAIHATVKIGNSIIAINREAPELGILSPVSLGACGGQIHLYVEDVDSSWERAVEAGALVKTALYDAYWGDRSGLLVDGNGHIWSLASKVENVAQKELDQRARAWYQAGVELPADTEIPFEVMIGQETLADDKIAV